MESAVVNTDFFRGLLVEKRKVLAEHLHALTEEVNPPKDPDDMFPGSPADQLDLGAETADNDRYLATAALEERQVQAIDAALERINRGDYGICDGCGMPIATQRLQLVPEAIMCMDCKRAAEEEATARKKGP
jgi:RNA polymerase-binding protein DksA